VAARCCKTVGPSIPDHSEFFAFEFYLRIDPAIISVSATLKACGMPPIGNARCHRFQHFHRPLSRTPRTRCGRKVAPIPNLRANRGRQTSLWRCVLHNIMHACAGLRCPVNWATNPKYTLITRLSSCLTVTFSCPVRQFDIGVKMLRWDADEALVRRGIKIPITCYIHY
jgi:hypothetical protein